MKNITFLILSLLFLVTNPISAVQTGNLPHYELRAEQNAKQAKKQKVKQQKKSKSKGKGLKNKPSLFSVLFGIGSLGAVIGSIGASFALSSLGVVVFAILGLGLGVLALLNGFKGIQLVRDNPDLKGTQIGAVTGLFLGGLALLALLAMTLGAIFG